MSGKLALLTGYGLVYLLLIVSAEECDKSKCKGPIRYYEDLNCKGIYAKEGDCCAVRYDCSHLNGRSKDKCYANGHEYAIGEQLKKEDRSGPCDIACTCIRGYNDVPQFTCAAVDCFRMGELKEGCYYKQNDDSCCSSEMICPKEGQEKTVCQVEGKTYMEGETFTPSNNPELSCQCLEGYKGENIPPFCQTIKCGTELRHYSDVEANCVPVFYSSQSPRTSCSFSYRCQNDNDTVIHPASTEETSDNKSSGGSSNSGEKKEDMMCKFGNMSMNIGDELNQGTDYSSVCVKCVCEVPPTPTCQRLTDDECDVTVHPNFN